MFSVFLLTFDIFSPQQHANSHSNILSIMFNAFWFLDLLFFYLSMLSPHRDNVKQGTGSRAILKMGWTLYCASVICRLSLCVAAAYLFMLLPICCWCCSWLLFAVTAGVSIFYLLVFVVAAVCCCCWCCLLLLLVFVGAAICCCCFMLLLFVVASIRACICYCLFVAVAFCCCCNLLLLIFLLVAIFSFCCLLLLLLFVRCICYLLLLQVVAVASCCWCYLLAYSRTPSSKFFTVRTRVRNQANLSPSTASTRSCQMEIYTASGSLLFIHCQACTMNVPFFVFICAEQHNIPRLQIY